MFPQNYTLIFIYLLEASNYPEFLVGDKNPVDSKTVSALRFFVFRAQLVLAPYLNTPPLIVTIVVTDFEVGNKRFVAPARACFVFHLSISLNLYEKLKKN